MISDLGCNTLLLEFVFPNIAGVSQPGRVEDADLWERLCVFNPSRNVGTYHCAVVARKFVKASRISLRVTIQTTVLVGVVEDFEVVVIDILASKDIGDEFQG